MKRAMNAAVYAQGNVSIKRTQNQTRLSFAEREKHLTKWMFIAELERSGNPRREFHTVGVR